MGFSFSAMALGLRLGLEMGVLAWLVECAFSGKRDTPVARSGAGMAFGLGLLFSLGILAASLSLPGDPGTHALAVRYSGYVFFVFFFFSALALILCPDCEMGQRGGAAVAAVAFVSAVFFISPEMVLGALRLGEYAAMRGGWPMQASSAAGGLVLAALPVALVFRSGLSRRAAGVLGPGQLLMAMVLVKLLAGGVGELSLVAVIKDGTEKFVHDVIHQMFVFFLVPDHPMLRTTAWNFIGFAFGSTASTAMTLMVLAFAPVIYLARNIVAPLPEPADYESGADRRIFRARARMDRAIAAGPVVAFLLVAVVMWYWGRHEGGARLYLPEPVPVVQDGGLVRIPLKSGAMNLRDGSLHKFSVTDAGRSVNLLVIAGPGGHLAVCLDACKICPPVGYGQRDDMVLCVYCMTPIPIDTLGRPGGCNPIPLGAEVTDSEVVVSMQDIRQGLGQIKGGGFAVEGSR